MATQTALITGASMGIGLSFAKLFAQKKCDLVLVARNQEKLDEIARELHQKHLIKVTVIAKDLSHLSSIDEIDTALKAKGIEIDYLINNAGFGDTGFFTETSWRKEHQMIELNITALTYLTKVFAPKMVERGRGRILNLASTAAFQPGPKWAVYFASKAYVLSFSEAIANELEGTGVTVTALCPGPTKSNFQEAANAGNSKLFRDRALPSSDEVAEFGYKAMMQGKPVAIHGTLNLIGAQSVRFAPRKLVTKLARKLSDG